MMFKLAQSASKEWRRLNCYEKIEIVIEGRALNDGILQDMIAA
jgi:putative transposase